MYVTVSTLYKTMNWGFIPKETKNTASRKFMQKVYSALKTSNLATCS